MTTRQPNRPFKFTKDELIDMHYNKNMSLTTIGRLDGRNPAFMSQKFKQWELIPKTKPTASKNITKDILSQYMLQGLSSREIAKLIGCTDTLINNKIKEFGFTPNNPNPFKRPEYRAKYDARMQSPIYKEKMRESSIALWTDQKYIDKTLNAYNSQESQQKIVNSIRNMPTTNTKPHIKVASILDSLNIKYENEYILGKWSWDIFIPEYKILIDVQGEYWHEKESRKIKDMQKSTYVDKYHTDLKIHYIWERECLQENVVLEKIKYWLGIYKLELIKFEFKDLIIGVVDTKAADDFLYNWHYRHHGRHGHDYGVFHNNVLVALARFTNPTRAESALVLGYKQENVLELVRFCINPRYQVPNLGSWFLSRVTKAIKQDFKQIVCLIAFSEGEHSGALYKATNWIQVGLTEPSYYYTSAAGRMHKRTLWDHAKKLGLTELEYANKYNYFKVPEQPKLKFCKKL